MHLVNAYLRFTTTKKHGLPVSLIVGDNLLENCRCWAEEQRSEDSSASRTIQLLSQLSVSCDCDIVPYAVVWQRKDVSACVAKNVTSDDQSTPQRGFAVCVAASQCLISIKVFLGSKLNILFS